jgi:flagellar biosynthesis GTPase FlhF
MKLSALNTIKYISYGFFISLSTSQFALADTLAQGGQLQEKMQQQEKAYHAQQQKLMALDNKQDEHQATNKLRENERLKNELLAQEKNAYLNAVEQQEADQLAEKAALEEMSQPEMETAYEREQKFKQYDDRLDMQGSY